MSKAENLLKPEKLKKLQEQVWENAVVHGWHERKQSPEHCCGLVMTEIAEAVEADRNNRRAYTEEFAKRLKCVDVAKAASCYNSIYETFYKTFVKGSVEEEFADVVIRLLDMAQEIHGIGMVWSGYYPSGTAYKKDASFIENAWFFVSQVLECGTMNISDSVSFIFDWAQHLDIDLWQHIEWKMKYNEIRPYKHGGKKY